MKSPRHSHFASKARIIISAELRNCNSLAGYDDDDMKCPSSSSSSSSLSLFLIHVIYILFRFSFTTPTHTTDSTVSVNPARNRAAIARHKLRHAIHKSPWDYRVVVVGKASLHFFLPKTRHHLNCRLLWSVIISSLSVLSLGEFSK